jgi:hypothetical protein
MCKCPALCTYVHPTGVATYCPTKTFLVSDFSYLYECLKTSKLRTKGALGTLPKIVSEGAENIHDLSCGVFNLIN